MIRVLIERNIAPGLAHYYESTIKRMMTSVINAPGCIAGESLKDSTNSNRRFVMSKWNTIEDWDRWYRSSERKQVSAEIFPLLEGDEKVTILELTH